MKAVLLFVVYTFAAVNAAPFLFNNDLLTKGHSAVATLTHASYTPRLREGYNVEGPLRYLYLVPTTAQKSYLADGLASGPLGYQPVVHKGLTPDFASGEMMTEVVGLSNCRTWHAVLVGFWNGFTQTYKYWTGLKTETNMWKWTPYDNLQALVDFVHGYLSGENFKALVKMGVGAHEFLLKLFASYA